MASDLKLLSDSVGTIKSDPPPLALSTVGGQLQWWHTNTYITNDGGKLSSGAPSFLKSVTLTTQRCATERRSLSDAYGAD